MHKLELEGGIAGFGYPFLHLEIFPIIKQSLNCGVSSAIGGAGGSCDGGGGGMGI